VGQQAGILTPSITKWVDQHRGIHSKKLSRPEKTLLYNWLLF